MTTVVVQSTKIIVLARTSSPKIEVDVGYKATLKIPSLQSATVSGYMWSANPSLLMWNAVGSTLMWS